MPNIFLAKEFEYREGLDAKTTTATRKLPLGKHPPTAATTPGNTKKNRELRESQGQGTGFAPNPRKSQGQGTGFAPNPRKSQVKA